MEQRVRFFITRIRDESVRFFCYENVNTSANPAPPADAVNKNARTFTVHCDWQVYRSTCTGTERCLSAMKRCAIVRHSSTGKSIFYFKIKKTLKDWMIVFFRKNMKSRLIQCWFHSMYISCWIVLFSKWLSMLVASTLVSKFRPEVACSTFSQRCFNQEIKPCF